MVDRPCTPAVSHHRLGDGVPRPGQRREPGSPRRLPFSRRRRRPPGRASGKPNRPSLLHAELLLHLLTLIKAQLHLPPAPPFTSELQLMESVHQHASGNTFREEKNNEKDKKNTLNALVCFLSRCQNHFKRSVMTAPVCIMLLLSFLQSEPCGGHTDTGHVNVKTGLHISHVVIMWH